MKLSFSLPTNKAKPVGAAPSLKRPAAFSSIDDDEPTDAAVTLGADDKIASNKRLLVQNAEYSGVTVKRMEAEKKVDSTVYQYDEVWDKMQEVKLRQKEAKEADNLTRKPKYIAGLLNSAKTRRLDHLRAEEKMIQREREREGDEFKDKEVFVTQAYKDQLAEIRRAEEEERLINEAEKKRKKDFAPTGLTHLYRKMLEESEQQHEETVAAAQKPVIGPMPNWTITKPPDFTPKSDLELAQIVRAQGREVELNDDNQIVDKRQLLLPGLNLSAPNTRRLGTRPMTAISASGVSKQAESHQAIGVAASRKEIQERRTKEMLAQIEDEKKRMAEEKSRDEDETTRRMIARRNTEAAIQSARERYLERKRQKVETIENTSGIS